MHCFSSVSLSSQTSNSSGGGGWGNIDYRKARKVHPGVWLRDEKGSVSWIVSSRLAQETRKLVKHRLEEAVPWFPRAML